MNIVNSAKPRQKSMPSMRFAGAAMFPRPDFIDRPRLTVIHFDRWLKCDDPRAVAWRCGEGPMACCHRGGRRHAQAAAPNTEFSGPKQRDRAIQPTPPPLAQRNPARSFLLG